MCSPAHSTCRAIRRRSTPCFCLRGTGHCLRRARERKCIGHAENMHRTWDFDVQRFLREGKTRSKWYFYSPNKFVKEAYKKCRADGSEDCTVGFPHLRKAHCMFGWDWVRACRTRASGAASNCG